MKEKIGENWSMINLSAIAGKTLRQIFTEATGREIVAEFIIEGKPCYFCGTTYWLNRMSKKGRAVTFAQAIELLENKNPGLLQEIIPHLKDIARIFPGATLQKHEQTASIPGTWDCPTLPGLF